MGAVIKRITKFQMNCRVCRDIFHAKFYKETLGYRPEELNIYDFDEETEEMLFVMNWNDYLECCNFKCHICHKSPVVLNESLTWVEELSSWYCNNHIPKSSSVFRKYRCNGCDREGNMIWVEEEGNRYCKQCIPVGLSIFR